MRLGGKHVSTRLVLLQCVYYTNPMYRLHGRLIQAALDYFSRSAKRNIEPAAAAAKKESNQSGLAKRAIIQHLIFF